MGDDGRKTPRSRGPARGRGRAGAARRLALRVLHDVDAGGAFVNLAADTALEQSSLSGPDRALVTEIAYGVTRWRGLLDYIIDSLSSHPVRDLPSWIRNILRMGLYQILFLDRIPGRAAVSESVALAREFGHGGTAALVNAILRRAASAGRGLLTAITEESGGGPGAGGQGGGGPVKSPGPVGSAAWIAVRGSHPEWLVRRWLDRYGPRTTLELCLIDNEPAPLVLRANVVRTGGAGLIDKLAAQGVPASPGRYFPEAVVCRGARSLRRLAAYGEGLFSVQDESAMSAARAVNPKPGWLVVDACAGVGGKTTHLAELMGNQGRVVAVDIFEHKLRLLTSAVRRLGLEGIETRRADARGLGSSNLAGTADAVLVDAPCSGLGVLRRRPDLKWRLTERDLSELAGLQAEILRSAAACVRPGGVLVYATCTLEPEENQKTVEGFLASNLEFVADNAAEAAGVAVPEGMSDPGVRTETIGEGPRGRYLAFTPASGGPDGFFVARLVRRLVGSAGFGGLA